MLCLGSMRVSPSLFHSDLMTTIIAPAKPRRRRAKRARKPATATMNQQQPMKVEIPAPRTRPDVELISRESYWNDYQNRMKIHDYELAEAMSDLKKLATWTNNSIKKLFKRVTEVEL